MARIYSPVMYIRQNIYLFTFSAHLITNLESEIDRDPGE